ncbi:MAG: DedA family protein [Desulfurella sp.]|uniref:DedA family protein n=1 Tax=Desulfurella sp. TaxID=1962857 RepID=UPI003D14DD32
MKETIMEISELTVYIQKYGLLFVFIFTFLETVVFASLIVPGETAVVLAGIMAQKGYLKIESLLIVVIVAAFLGYLTSYFIGTFFGDLIIKKRLLKDKYYKPTQFFFERYGGISVLFSRFLSLLRSFTALVAGISKMNFAVFVTFDAIGAVLWSFFYVYLGYFLGFQFQEVEKYFGIVGIIMLVGGILILYLFYKYKAKRR